MRITDDELKLWEFNQKHNSTPYRLWRIGRDGEYHLSENMVTLEAILLTITQHTGGRFVVDKGQRGEGGTWEFPGDPK